MTTEAQLAKAFKALANESRLTIYQQVMLHQRNRIGPEEPAGCLVFDMINKLNIGAPTVSHHVKELVNAGLITVERDGKFLVCHLDEQMRQALGRFFETR
jgi:DNA-binding transcriptional ArsR family regulator